MKLLFKKTLEKVQSFLYGQDEPTPIQNNSLATTIQQAIQKKTAVHIIFSETSFTGDIIKYDTERQQLIVKNFAKNITLLVLSEYPIFGGLVLSLQPFKLHKKTDLRKSEMIETSHSF